MKEVCLDRHHNHQQKILLIIRHEYKKALAPFVNDWAATYGSLKSLEISFLTKPKKANEHGALNDLMVELEARKELNSMLASCDCGIDVKKSIKERTNSSGEKEKFLPPSSVLPYIVERESTLIREKNVEGDMLETKDSLTKRFLLTITKYGTRDPSFKKPSGVKGVIPLTSAETEESVVHILLECLFREVQGVRERIEHAGGTILEDTCEIIWNDELLLDDDKNKKTATNEVEKEKLENKYHSTPGLLIEILNDKLTPEDAAARLSFTCNGEKENVFDLQSSNCLPYDPEYVLHLANLYKYYPAALSVYMAKGDVLAQMNYHMERGDTKAVLSVYFDSIMGMRGRNTVGKQQTGDGNQFMSNRDEAELLDETISWGTQLREGIEGHKRNVSNSNNATTQPLFWEELVTYLIHSGENEELNKFLETISRSVDPVDIIKVMGSLSGNNGVTDNSTDNNNNNGYDSFSNASIQQSPQFNATYKSSSLISAKETIRRRVENTQQGINKLNENIKQKSKEQIAKYKEKIKNNAEDNFDLIGNSNNNNTGNKIDTQVIIERQYNYDTCCICNKKISFPLYTFKCGHVAHVNCYSRDTNDMITDFSSLDKERDIPMFGLRTRLHSCSNYIPYCPKCIRNESLPVFIHLNHVTDDEISRCPDLDSVISLFKTQKYYMMNGGGAEL